MMFMLYENLRTFITFSRWIFLIIRKFLTKVVEKRRIHIFYVIIYIPKRVPFMRQCDVYVIWKPGIWYSRRGHRWQYNTAHKLRMLSNYRYRHTQTIEYLLFHHWLISSDIFKMFYGNIHKKLRNRAKTYLSLRSV